MEEFVYIPDEEFNEISKRPKQKEMRILKQKSESGKGFVAQVFIGYFGTMEESFDQKKCAAVRITPKSKDTEGENTLKVIRKIYKELPESGRKHIITFFDIGKVSGTQDYVAVMELAKGNLKDVYKGENLDTKEAIKRLEKQIGKIVVPALEMHEIFAHLDLKFANYVVVSNDINGSRINKEGGKEEEDEVVKAIDFGASTLLDDGGIMPAGNNAAKANCLVKPLWEFRTEEIAGPEYGDDDIQVSPKTDMYSIGILIYEFILLQPKWNHYLAAANEEDNAQQQQQQKNEKMRRLLLEKISDIYRGFRWVETDELLWEDENGKFMDKDEEKPIYEPKWLLEYADAILVILQVRQQLPHIFLLLTNILDVKKRRRLSAPGVLEYLTAGNKCKPLLQFRAGKNLVLFDEKITGKKLLEIAQNGMRTGIGGANGRGKLEKIINMLANKDSERTFKRALNAIETRMELCEH